MTNRLSEKLATIATGNPARVFYAAYGVPESGANTSAALPRDAIRLLYSGRLENDQKRVMDLAGMMQALVRRGVNASLSIAGGGPAGGEFREGLARLGVQDRVHFLGVLEPRRLAEEYAAHAALVITSSWETGPIVAWEAMSHGLPVISTRYIGSGLEGALVHGENCLLFSVGDVAAAADCVAMLRDRLLVERIVLGGRALVADRYSRAASVRQWHEALTAILALPLLPTPGEDPEHRVRSRLDRLLGLAWAERIRRWSGLHYRHRDKGGEWPHSAHRHSDLQAWRANLALLDVGPDGPSRSAAL